MPKVGKLEIDLAAGVARLQTDVDKANKILSTGAQKMERIAGGVASAFAALGVGLSVGAFANGVKNIANAADQMGKLSQKVGVGVESLSALKYAGELSDVSMESLSIGLKQLNKNIDEGDEGFKRLGINLQDANGRAKTTEEVMLEVADRFATMEDGATKTALAMQLFGKSGADLIPLLNGGSKGIKAMTDEARMLGVVINDSAAKAAEQFNDNLTRLNAQLEGLKMAVGGSLIQHLAKFTEALVQGAAAGENIFRSMNALANLPFFGGNAAEQLQNINRELKDVAEELRLFGGVPGVGAALGVRQSNLLSMKRLAELNQRQDAMGAAGPGNYDARDLALRNPGTPFVPAPKPGKKDTTKDKAAQEWRQLQSDIEQFNAEVDRAQNEALASRMRTLDDQADAEKQAAQDQMELARDIAAFNADVDRAQQDSMEASQRNFDALAKKQKDAAKDMVKAIEGFGRSTSRVMAQILTDGKTASDGLSDMFRAFFQEMIEQILYKQVFGPVFSAAGDAFGGMLGGLFGGGDVVELATGTNYVPRDGMAMLHKGEAVVPKAFNDGGFGGAPNITIVNNIDSRSDIQTIMGATNLAVGRAKSEIMRSMQRNGAFAKATR